MAIGQQQQFLFQRQNDRTKCNSAEEVLAAKLICSSWSIKPQHENQEKKRPPKSWNKDRGKRWWWTTTRSVNGSRKKKGLSMLANLSFSSKKKHHPTSATSVSMATSSSVGSLIFYFPPPIPSPPPPSIIDIFAPTVEEHVALLQSRAANNSQSC